MAPIAGIRSLALTGGRAPLWYQIALILIVPAASLAGGEIRTRQTRDKPKSRGQEPGEGRTASAPHEKTRREF